MDAKISQITGTTQQKIMEDKMFKFKAYVPDQGLGDIVVLNTQEFNKLIETVVYSDWGESNAEEKENKQTFLEWLNETKEWVFPSNAKDLEFLIRKYEIEERVGCILHEANAERHEAWSRRYKILKANSKLKKK